MLLAETREGYHNLIKLVSAGYTEGFYYKPRIDKELLAQHADGLIGLCGCLKGEVATASAPSSGRRPSRQPRRTATSSDRATSSSRCSIRASTSSVIVNAGLQPIAQELGLPLVCTNDVHYLHPSDFKPHDMLVCIGTGKDVNDADRLRYHGDQFYLKTPEEMAELFRLPGGAGQHRRASRSGVT